MIADLLCLIGQIVGVYAYAVAANEAGREWEKVPFAAGGLKYLLGVYAQLVEQNCQLIDQCDIQVALCVLYDLGRLGDLDAARQIGAGTDDALVEFID